MVEHLEKQTIDGAQLNLDALYQICPTCFTEKKDKDGTFKVAVDWNKLRILLGDNTVEDEPNTYEFKWVGKRESLREASAPIDKTLRPFINESVNWDETENLYIEGDNLEVLKLLQNSYMGKVKIIYIDPPYNTGGDFIYKDKRVLSEEDYENAISDEDGNRYIKNTYSNGAFHSDWCSMMYSRLIVARTLLKEDGVIFISIGVEEFSQLKAICNEVFGESNFVEVFSWVKTSTPPSLATKSRKTNEYILCYEKNKSGIKYNGELLDGGDQPLLNTGNARTVLTFPKDKVLFNPKKFPDGIYTPSCPDRVALLDQITITNGKADKDFRLEGEFKWSADFLKSEIDKGTTFVVKSDKLSIRFIREGEGYKRPTNFIKDKYTSPLIDKPGSGVGTNETATSHLNSIMDGLDVFSYPKPESLIKYLINFVAEEGDIVMDFFSGSGTTGESTFLHNIEKCKLRFILVQLQEDLDKALPKADANSKVIIENGIKFLDKYNKPHLITELAKERLRRVGKELKQSFSLDYGFRVFKCDSSNYKPVEFTPNQYTQKLLFDMESNIKDDRTDIDLLFDCMLRWGVELSLPVSSMTVSGCKIHIVDDGELVACFDGKLNDDAIDAIAEVMPARIVFRDSSFEEASQKMNIYELFKQKCGWEDEVVKKRIRVI